MQQFNLNPPVNDVLLDKNGKFTQSWQQFFNQLNLFFQNQFTQNYIVSPNVTNDELSALSTIQNGTITYNSSTNEFQGYKNGAWVVFNTTP